MEQVQGKARVVIIPPRGKPVGVILHDGEAYKLVAKSGLDLFKVKIDGPKMLDGVDRSVTFINPLDSPVFVHIGSRGDLQI